MRSTILVGALLALASAAPLSGQDCPNGNCQSGNCQSGNCQSGNSGQGNCQGGYCSQPFSARHPFVNHMLHHPPKHGNANAQYRASQTPWHGNYYYTQWGAPVALVVPPTAEYQTNYSWGAPASSVSRIDHQFQHGYPGGAAGGSAGQYGFLPTPQFPNDTRQFGVYYVRGPW